MVCLSPPSASKKTGRAWGCRRQWIDQVGMDMTSRKPSSKARIAALAAVMVLSGCATTNSAIRTGSAKLVPHSVSGGDSSFIYALVEIRGDRHSISVNTAGCWSGVGTIFVDDLSPSIDVVRDGNKNEDELFRQICETAKVQQRPAR
jgi:hypothetical protein